MRRLSLFVLVAFCCCFALSAPAQSPRPQASRSASPKPAAQPSAKATAQPSATPASSSAAATPVARPRFRPAVLPTGRDSLINRINVDDLLKKGQKEGALQFLAMVNADGTIEDFAIYHALPNCEALEEEVGKQLVEARFTPPIFEHQPVKALLVATVLFDDDTTPHLRILLNQDPREIEAGNDYIAPQAIVGDGSKFTGLHPPEALPVKILGIVNFVAGVDRNGNLLTAQVTSEEPPLLGLAQAVADDLQNAKFIPAFRDGDPIDTEVIMAVCYKPLADEEEGGSGLELSAPPPQPTP